MDFVKASFLIDVEGMKGDYTSGFFVLFQLHYVTVSTSKMFLLWKRNPDTLRSSILATSHTKYVLLLSTKGR